MPKRVLCKFFAHGACLKGEHCEFSHDWKAPPNNICTFYQKGICAYGSRCQYEHVKVSRYQSSAHSSQELLFPYENPSGTASVWSTGITPNSTASSESFSSTTRSEWKEKPAHHNIVDNERRAGCFSNIDPINRSMCSFASVGNCPHGGKCPHVHSDVCPICGEQCLHPFRPAEREHHVKVCEKRQKHFEALKRSKEMECSVCLEHVFSKPTSAERKFGILSECDHPFCISCIRNWRNSSPTSGLDINSALRACPICRKHSYFVIPSVIWYSSKEEKQDIIDSYKAKLSSIDCKHFDFGNGTCPFGNSCFYKHAYCDGRLEEVVLRHLGAKDGKTTITKNFRLSEFLRNLHIM